MVRFVFGWPGLLRQYLVNVHMQGVTCEDREWAEVHGYVIPRSTPQQGHVRGLSN